MQDQVTLEKVPQFNRNHNIGRRGVRDVKKDGRWRYPVLTDGHETVVKNKEMAEMLANSYCCCITKCRMRGKYSLKEAIVIPVRKPGNYASRYGN